MKFDMGADTLTTLGGHTITSGDDLSGLVTRLVDSIQPLEGKFNGRGREAFQYFKEHADEIAVALRISLGQIQEGQSGMETAFASGDQEQEDNARQSQSAMNFDAAKF
ncbi:hypothetical protein ACWGNE_14400 [Streptomyces xiamenensis]|uniref:hypothetical protein n=1 Tax=Streptomyces xiamenensis TaxID=408015 RepID=UPI0036BE1B49